MLGQNSKYGIFESYRKQLAAKSTPEQYQSGTEKNAKKKTPNKMDLQRFVMFFSIATYNILTLM